MKAYTVILLILHVSSIPKVEIRKARKLNDNSKLPLANIRKQIDEIHEEVVKCIDEEFAKDYPKPPKEILATCVGEDFTIIKHFYQDEIQSIKDMMREKLKFILEDEFCKDYMESCKRYYDIIIALTNKDYDLELSFEFNKMYLEKQFDKDVLKYLIEMTTDNMRDFDEIRKKLIEEYRFVKTYFADKFHEFKNNRLKDKYIINDEERAKIRLEIEKAKEERMKEKHGKKKNIFEAGHESEDDITI